MTSPLLIGLTGPIGCGKSTIAGWLHEAGGVVIDADRIAREVTESEAPALPLIRARFGDRVFREDGSLDRAALAEVVFSDPDALGDLEAIVHPRVREQIERRVEDARRSGARFVAVEAIKLVEAGYAQQCDEVWLIECSPAAQLERLTARGASADDAQRRVVAQGHDLIERLAAHETRRIATDGSREETRSRVDRALREALAAARG